MRRHSSATLALDGPPPVTLGLRRFVMRSVGPAAARFHPLDLDLVTLDGSVARRALCVLTNTGGKSTLLKLLAAVVNPGTAGLIGKGEVADMVLATDTSHVVLEWQQADGARYVSGWLAQWDGLQKPQSGTKGLRQCWYFFRSNGVGVDDLPFEHDGRRVRWDEYRRQLRALFGEHPGAAGYIADTQVDWARVLVERTRIDAELFRYQATMNAAESGAAALVTRLKTPDAFVGFFVSAFDDDALTATLFREVAAYTAQAASRATMETHAALCAELVEALQSFQHEHGNHTAAVDMEARRKQYLYLEAEMRRATALEAEAEAEAAEREADLQRSAWAVVPAVVAHDAATAAHGEAKAAFDAAEQELAPLRARVEEAAGRLVAGLVDRATSASAEAAQARQRVERAKGDAARAIGRREEALKEAAGLRHDLQAADVHSAQAAQLVAEARRRDDVAAGETAAQASERWLAVQDHATESRRRAAADKSRAAAARREAMQDRNAAEIALRDANAASAAAREALRQAATSAARLLADPDVVAVMGGPAEATPPHRTVPAEVATAAAATVDHQAEGVERSAQDTWADLRSVEAELGRLAGTDLLDAGPDVVSALGVLRDAHIGALAGWTWIAGTVPAEDRPAFTFARPDIANGVVVNDPSRLDDARRALEKAGLFPRLAVVVTTSRTATTTANDLPLEDSEGDRFVVEPHPGLYDKEKAKEEIARLDERQAMLASRHDEQVVRARELREAAGLARRHAVDWPGPKLEAIEGRLAEANSAIAEAIKRADLATTALRAAAQAEQDSVETERAAGKQESAAGAARLRLAGVVQAEAAAVSHAAARPGTVELIARHDREAALAGKAAAEATAAAELATREQRDSEQVAQASKERVTQIGAPAAALVPTQPIHVLEAAYAEADRRFADEAAGRDHHEALERAKETVSRTAEPLTGIPEDVLDLARRHSTSVLAGTPDAIRTQIAASVEAWKAANERKSQRRRDVERWEAEANTHRPTDRIAHATLAPDEIPADADDAARRASDLSGALVAARVLRDSQQAARDAAQHTRDDAAAATTAFARLVSGQDDPVAGADPYPGDVDSAFDDRDRRRKAVDDARSLVNEARLARQRAAGTVNNRANNKRWADITDSLKELCASATAEALSEHGARYLDGLRTRERSLRADIADLDTHRSAVIDSLGQTCDRLRRNLHREIGRAHV